MTFHAHIIGAGAIGSLLAAHAQSSNVNYTIHKRAASQPVTTVSPYFGQPIKLNEQTKLNQPWLANDVLFLPLKAYQIEAAILQWQGVIHADSPIILLHNGMGGAEIARQHLPSHLIYVATTSHGALKTSQSTVRHTGLGETLIGPADAISQAKHNPQVIEWFKTWFEPVTWYEQMHLPLWRKLAINAAINPLTAIHNVKNGELSHTSYQQVIEQVCDEVCHVAQALGINLETIPTLTLINSVIHKTADNYSSMHQDIHAKRPTEIAAISGYVIEQAKKKGIDVPANTLLYSTIMTMERDYS